MALDNNYVVLHRDGEKAKRFRTQGERSKSEAMANTERGTVRAGTQGTRRERVGVATRGLQAIVRVCLLKDSVLENPGPCGEQMSSSRVKRGSSAVGNEGEPRGLAR